MAEFAHERRNFCRMNTALNVLYGKQTANFTGVLDSLGFGGARIRSPQTFPKDSTFVLVIPLPEQTNPFEAHVRVTWVQEKDSMGVQFLDLNREEILLLEKLLTPTNSGMNHTDLWD